MAIVWRSARLACPYRILLGYWKFPGLTCAPNVVLVRKIVLQMQSSCKNAKGADVCGMSKRKKSVRKKVLIIVVETTLLLQVAVVTDLPLQVVVEPKRFKIPVSKINYRFWM